MTNVLKNRIMRVLAVMAMVCVGVVCALQFVTVKAEGTVAESGFAMQTGATVYIDGEDDLSGIGFITEVEKSFVDANVGEGDTIKYYTLVTAAKNLTNGDITSLTVENADALDAVKIQAIEAPDFSGEATKAEYMVGITYENTEFTAEELEVAYATQLVGRSYVIITNAEGEENVIYAQANDNIRSIREVAAKTFEEALEGNVDIAQLDKMIGYLATQDVQAFQEVAGKVDFIDQDLDGAKVYSYVAGTPEIADDPTTDENEYVAAVESTITELGDIIQNGALTGTIPYTAAYTKHDIIVVKDGVAFKSTYTEVTKIINDLAEFKQVFEAPSKESLVADGTLDTASKYVNIFIKQAWNDLYYVLANNIDFEGADFEVSRTVNKTEAVTLYNQLHSASITETDISAHGTRQWTTEYRTLNNVTFDGLGHYVANYVAGVSGGAGYGPFGVMAENNTVKNVAFLNVEFARNNSTVIGRNSNDKSNTLENVYVRVSEISPRDNGSGTTYRFGGLFTHMQYGTLRNVVIEYPDVNEMYDPALDSGKFYGHGYMFYGNATYYAHTYEMENVVAITTTLSLGNYSSVSFNMAENDTGVTNVGDTAIAGTIGNYAGVNRYDNFDVATQANAFAGFTSSCWSTYNGQFVWAQEPIQAGTVMFSAKDKFIPTEIYELIEGEMVSVTDAQGNELYDNGRLLGIENNTNAVVDKYVIVKTDANLSFGVNLAVYTDIITSEAEFTSTFMTPDDATYTMTNNLTLTAEQALEINGDATQTAWSESHTGPKSDFSKNAGGAYYFELSEAAQALIADGATRQQSGVSIHTATLTGAYALGADLDGLNNKGVSSYGGQIQYFYKVAAPTPANANKAAYDNAGYKLAGCNEFFYNNQSFVGLFDGMGHTISNVTLSDRGGLFGSMGAGTIQNLAVVDVNYTSYYNGVFSYTSTGDTTVKDVYINVDSIKNGDSVSYDRDGIIFGNGNNYSNISNIIVDFPQEVELTASAYGFGLSGCATTITGDASNVYYVTPTQFVTVYNGGSDAGDRLDVAENEADRIAEGGMYYSQPHGSKSVANGVYRYDTFVDMGTANNNYSAFNATYWDFSTGIPVWKGLASTTEDWRDAKAEQLVITIDGVVADSVTFEASDADTKTIAFELTGAQVEVTGIEDEAVATYADGVITRVAKGATRLDYTFTIGGKVFNGYVVVNVAGVITPLGEADYSGADGVLPTAITESLDGAVVEVALASDVTTNLYNAETGKISITNDTNAVVTNNVIITTESGAQYSATLNTYTKIITTAAEYKEWLLKDSYTYTVTHNLVLSDGVTAWSETRTGTIDDFKQSNGWYYYELSAQALELLAGGASRKADTYSMTQTISGAYALGADIEDLAGVPNNGFANKMFRYVTSANAESTATSGSLDNGSYKLAGANSPFSSSKFEGYFDGKGHKIVNYQEKYSGGLFGTLNGTVKNFAMTGISLTGNTQALVAFKVGSADAVIENVYIEVTEWTADNTHRNGFIIGSQSASVSGFTVKNVLIVAPTVTFTDASGYTGGVFGAGYAAYSNHVNAENLVVVSGTEWLMRHNTTIWKASNDDALSGVAVPGTYRYADMAAAQTASVDKVGNWAITYAEVEGVVTATVAWADDVNLSF